MNSLKTGSAFLTALTAFTMTIGSSYAAPINAPATAAATGPKEAQDPDYYRLKPVVIEELDDSANDFAISEFQTIPGYVPPTGIFPLPVPQTPGGVVGTNPPTPIPVIVSPLPGTPGVTPIPTIPGLPSNGVNAGGVIGAIAQAAGAISQVTGSINAIVNTAKAIWTVITDNKPVATMTTDVANAIPQNSTAWDALAGWSAPQTKLFHVVYTNYLNVNVIDFTYRVIYFYGGNVGGKGAFLAGVSIVPANLDVSWGYKFSAQAKVPSTVNVGASDNPIAAMQLQLDWSVDTMLSHEQSAVNFYVRGDGQFSQLN